MLMAVHFEDVAGDAHVGGIVGVVDHDVQEVKPRWDVQEVKPRWDGIKYKSYREGPGRRVLERGTCASLHPATISHNVGRRAHTHTHTHARTHLDKMAGGSATLYLSGLALSYRPPRGLAAARIDALAFRVACVEDGRGRGSE